RRGGANECVASRRVDAKILRQTEIDERIAAVQIRRRDRVGWIAVDEPSHRVIVADDGCRVDVARRELGMCRKQRSRLLDRSVSERRLEKRDPCLVVSYATRAARLKPRAPSCYEACCLRWSAARLRRRLRRGLCVALSAS